MVIGIARRQFISALGGTAVAWPLAARAQQSERIRRLGLLLARTQDDFDAQQLVAVFVQALRDLGWTDGGNIRIDYRWCGADASHIHTAASELVDLKPDAILAQTALTLAPLRQMTTTIQIVFMQIVDPVGSGFVTNLARPDGNITGFASSEFAMSGKLLEVLKELAPQIDRAAVIYNQIQAPQVGQWHAIEAAAPSLGVKVSAASAGSAEELTANIEDFAHEPSGGMIVLSNPITTANRGLIFGLMARHRLPAVYQYAYWAKEGGLASYGTELAVQYRQAASYVDRILRGTKISELPVQQPTKFELSINLKTAKALGLTVPALMLGRADEVIE
jgi:putative tryptophan/tyrosine transport system substrate-binding protein